MSPAKYHKAVQPSSERPVFDRLKEHPIWVFCSGAAAMAAFAITVIMPGTTAYLRAQIENLTPAHEQLGKANERIEKLNSELKILKKERDEAVTKSPFTAGSAYPKGLSSVTIGSPTSKIAEVFPNAKVQISENDDGISGYQALDTGHSVFNHIAYYYDKSGKTNTITTILLMSHGSGLSHEYLYSQLIQLNGPPKVESKGRYFWEIKPRESIALEGGNLHIYKYGYIPMWVQTARDKKSR